MLDFFEQQAAARRRTTLCVVLYGIAVAVVTFCVVPVMVLLFLSLGLAVEDKHERGQTIERFFDQAFTHPIDTFSHGSNAFVLLVSIAATLALIFGSSAVKYVSLRSGGRTVAEGMGATRIQPGTTDIAEKRLLNVVEEMALASSIPVPAVYVMEEEGNVNAFAAGHSPSDAVVCVTRGTLERLTREQLQGVVGHEFSHILNGDMRLNLRLMGLLFGIVCVELMGRILFQMRGGRKNYLPVLGIILIVIGAAGALAASIIKAMISRQREYLADASSVQFTRNPEGIAGALKVIGAVPGHGRLITPKAEECSHMFFAEGTSSFVSGVFATHPPLTERIRRLEPGWDGKWPKLEQLGVSRAAGSTSRPEMNVAAMAAAAALTGPAKTLAVARARLQAESNARRPVNTTPVGALTPEEVFARVPAARAILDDLPPALVTAARDPYDARALLLATLLSSEALVRSAQLTAVAATLGQAVAAQTQDLAARIAGAANDRARLPLIDLSLASLAALSLPQYQAFRTAVNALIHADSRIDLYELCLKQLLVKHLDRRHIRADPVPVQYYSLARLGDQCAALIAAATHAGGMNAETSAHAFAAAMESLGFARPLAPPSVAGELDTARIEAALATLRQVTPKLRAGIVRACAAVVGIDGQVTAAEAELLRAIADTLDVPLAIMPA